MATSHIYPGAYSLNAYITLKDCNKAIEFYKKAFGAKEKGKLLMPDGKVAHAEVEIEGSCLMMCDEIEQWKNKSVESLGGTHMSFSLYVKDVDSAFKKALDAGAKELVPVEDMFYGDRVGQVMDPFGYIWMIATHKEDLSYEEMQRRGDEMFAPQAK